jgi:hypothetical protein
MLHTFNCRSVDFKDVEGKVVSGMYSALFFTTLVSPEDGDVDFRCEMVFLEGINVVIE